MVCYSLSALCLTLLLFAAADAAFEGDVCQLAPDTGFCRAAYRKFYYNSDQDRCEEFTYGGCGGNGNRFETIDECEQACRLLFPSPNKACNLPRKTGVCLAHIPSYFYNTDTGSCERFIYGGCGGNSNRFWSKRECQETCGVAPDLERGNHVCQEPKKIGPCRAAFRRWFFNKDTLECEPFIFGGCHANGNNFRSREECQRRCHSSRGQKGGF